MSTLVVTYYDPDQHDIGRAIAAGRALAGQTQSQLAAALTEATGQDYSADQITNLESGRKIVRASLLRTISRIQNLPMEFYTDPVPGTSAKGVLLSSDLSTVAA